MSAFNAAADLLGRHGAADAERTAFIDEYGSITYGALAERVDRAGGALRALGLQQEQRVILCLLDTIDFPTAFLGAIKAGIVPIPINTLFQAPDYAFILRDSRARVAIVSAELLPTFRDALERAEWSGTIVVSDPGGAAYAAPFARFADLLAAATPLSGAAETHADEACFWLYSSGSTGTPKGTVHVHSSLTATARLFGDAILGLGPNDVVYSAAKLFFAYGLGNALTFPLFAGATSVLYSGRVTADVVFGRFRDAGVTVFCGVPTLFAGLLVAPAFPAREELALRLCTSAGELLPEEIGRSWTERTGVEIIDGIGSTEMLHIFLSNRPGAVRYGTTGLPVPGYTVRLVDETGALAALGEIGELEVSGPTAAAGYWNNREKTRRTFAGEWTRTGDKFVQLATGEYVHCGRADDMLKVSGIWVSPTEVEGALIAHEHVMECAVIGCPDEQELIKPKAFIILKPGIAGDEQLVDALKLHVKSRLAPYKYPRWIEFVDELPKTPTGKIQRHLLRARSAVLH